MRRDAIHQADAVARRQHYFALRGGDHTLVGDVVTDQINAAAERGGDLPLIDYRCAVIAVELEVVRQKVRVGDVERGSDQAVHVNDSSRAKHDAVRVDQKHLAVGSHGAQNLAGVWPGHAIEHGGLRGLLDELGGLPLTDIELLPVQNRARRVGHGQGVAAVHNRGRAVDDGRTDRVRQRQRGKTRGNRDDGQL